MSASSTTPIDAPSPLVLTSTTPSGKVRILTLNRPKSLNAISRQLAQALFASLQAADQDASIRAVILTGSGRAFSAGADIKQLRHLTSQSAFEEDWLGDWNRTITSFRKPLLCAVNGYALGGGAELAMMCDILHCNESATFSLPEITLGTLPGAGGTQRLLRAVGKSRAFEMILTGDRMSAEEALEKGLVSKVWKDDQLMPGVVKLAERIADMSCTALMTAKQAVNVTQKQVLDALHIEKALYHMSFDSDSFKEGVSAFVEKRKANF